MILRFQKRGLCLRRFLFGKLRDNAHTAVIRIAAVAENIVYDRLRHGKSEGRVRERALRFVDAPYLFRFRQEEAELPGFFFCRCLVRG